MSEPPTVILFVDDEEAILRIVVRMLQGSPFEVLTASSAAEALRILAERRIDVLVSDIDMPEVDGLELVRRVQERYPTTLRMLLTGSATVERALHAINEGEVVRFFTKPFKLDLFRASIAALVERIERSRRDHVEGLRAARQRELEDWLNQSYPGLLDIERTASGAVVIDVAGLDALGEI